MAEYYKDTEHFGKVVGKSQTFTTSNPKEAIQALKNEPKHGRWIEDSEGWWHCSECGRQIPPTSKQDLNEFHKWCGRCGARMDEVKE